MFRNFLIIFLCFYSLLFSLNDKTNSSLALTEGDPSSLIKGCVSAITGNFYLNQNDIVIFGQEPIFLKSQYISLNNPKINKEFSKFFGWDFLNYLEAKLSFDKITIPEENGSKLTYSIPKSKKYKRKIFESKKRKKKRKKLNQSEKKKRKILTLDKSTYKNFLTNCSTNEISGRLNLRNNIVEIFDAHNLIVHEATSGKRFYQKENSKKNFKLRCISRPNGNKILFFYDTKERISEIKTTNHNKQIEYAFAKFEYPNKEHKEIIIKTSDKRLLKYQFIINRKNQSTYRLVSINTDEYQQKLNYSKDNNLLGEILYPDNQKLQIRYYKKGSNDNNENIPIQITSNLDPRIFRVKCLMSPVGIDEKCHITHRFFYSFSTLHPINDKKGLVFDTDGFNTTVKETNLNDNSPKIGEKTIVFDAYNNKTIYFFSKNYRLEKIEKYQLLSDNQKLYSTELFSWESKNNDEISYLLAKSILNDAGKVIYSKRYFYDQLGNPIKETIFGNISGKCQTDIVLDKKNLPIDNGVEKYEKHRKYSTDGRLLLLEKNFNNGLKVLYKYHPTKILKIAKYTYDHDEIKLRNFYEYDDNFVLVKEIEDNGSSINKENSKISKFTKYIPRKIPPFAGITDTIIKGYLDIKNGQEKQLLRTKLSYSKKGQILQKDIFDEKDNFAYSLKYTYNDQGDLISETNPIGQIACYKYDKNHNKIREVDFAKRTTNFYYDFSNRLIKEEFITKDGKTYTTRHKYDKKHNKIETIDFLGNSTKYSYDAFGSLIKKISPRVLDESGQSVSIEESFQYDIFGNEIFYKDPKKNITKTVFNIFNKPIKKTYADGFEEFIVYNLDGTLKKHIDQEKVITKYFYDIFGREISKKVYFPSNRLLKEDFRKYNGFAEIEYIDPEKNITKYSYDGSGRKISKKFIHSNNGKIEKKDFFYDSLGQLYKTNIENAFSIEITKDYLDRIIEEKKINLLTNEIQFLKKFTYDAASNKNTVITYPNNSEAIINQYFDDFDRIVKKVDPLGNITEFIYEDQKNTLKKQIKINPHQIKSITTFDALDRITSIEKKDANENRISFIEKFYDKNSNLSKIISHVITPAKPLKKITTYWQYDEMDRLKILNEASGSKEQKTNTYDYTAKSLLKTIIKPNNATLNHIYDAFGNLTSLTSSDNTISYTYKYNLLNELIESIDLTNNLSTVRELDGKGQILSEKLASENILQYSYDEIGRKTSIIYPDQSSSSYIYDGLYLKEIIRKDFKENCLYSHKFKEYDNFGNLLKEQLINEKDCEYSIDKLGRKKAFINPYTFQKLKFDNLGRVLSNKTNDDKINYEYDDLGQVVLENGSFYKKNYSFDSTNNVIQKGYKKLEINDLNQTTCIENEKFFYGLSGNLQEMQSQNKNSNFSFDALDRLIQVIIPNKTKLNFIYDSFDRRIIKKVYFWKNSSWQKEKIQNFLYDGQNEIGSSDENGKNSELRILKKSFTEEIGSSIAFEFNGQIYIPIHDLFGNVITIINKDSDKISESYKYTVFGKEIEKSKSFINPWRFCSKRLDNETGFSYFGKRYYFPKLQKWISNDPCGFKDGMNLYQFALNNPLIYKDPQGERVLGFCVGLGEILLGGGLMFSGAALEIATFGGYTFCFGFQEAAGLSFITDGLARTMYNAKDLSSFSAHNYKNNDFSIPTIDIPNDTYFPDTMEKRWIKKGRIDPTLPTDPFNDPNWEDDSHEEAKKSGHYRFKNKNTGKKIEFDRGKPGEPGHKGRDHYHRPNPNAKNKYDSYLDEKGNPVPNKSDPSHLYPPKWQ